MTKRIQDVYMIIVYILSLVIIRSTEEDNNQV